jgi:DNA invertase Pin-like site-specific DNA recombinase
MNGADTTMPNYCALAMAIMTETNAQRALVYWKLVPERRPLYGEDKAARDAEIVRRHLAGETPAHITREMNVHRQTVYNALKAAGIVLRKKGETRGKD